MKTTPKKLLNAALRSASLTACLTTATPANATEPGADADAATLADYASREFKVEQRYLHLPIKNGAPLRKVTLVVDGRVEGTNDVELADAQADWWAFIDVSAWRGQTATVRVAQLPKTSTALGTIEPGDSPKGAEALYREALRPQLHFSPQRGWMNDPNGLVFYRGEYHLFFQHNPYGWKWGNMHWGHATSRDLVHWQEQGEALRPDSLGAMFSGSAVVDGKDTSGFGREGAAPLVLIYTAFGEKTVQGLASSVDGRTFTKFGGNPVVKEITSGNRDPKVFWHEPTRKWVMVLYVGLPVAGGEVDAKGQPLVKHAIQFLTSPNLRDWTVVSANEGGIGGDRYLYECPDLFELAVDGDVGNKKWVLLGGNSEYAIGTFDGTKFTPEAEKIKGYYGSGFYAPQTYSDLPDGRRIQIGWGQAPSPGMPFNQVQMMPCELSLRATPEGVRLARRPVRELLSLREGANQGAALGEFRAELIELRAEFEPGRGGVCEVGIRGAKIIYDGDRQELIVNGARSPAPLLDGKQRLAVYVDRTVIEVFASDGLTYIPMPFIPKPDERSVMMEVRGVDAKMTSLEVYRLKSIWETSSSGAGK